MEEAALVESANVDKDLREITAKLGQKCPIKQIMRSF
jgi:hypothetical protein